MEETTSIRKILVVFVFVLIMLITFIFITYSMNYKNPRMNLVGSIMKLDEESYGNTLFDASNLDFRPILDKDVNNESSNVIYIDFNVGGSIENDSDNIIYDVALVDLDVDCELLSPYLKWKLLKNNIELSSGSFDYKFDTIKDGRLVLTDIQQNLVSYSEDKSIYDHYDFYIWLSDSCQEDNILECNDSVSQSNLLGKRLDGKIEVELYTGDKKVLVREPHDVRDDNTCFNEGGDTYVS